MSKPNSVQLPLFLSVLLLLLPSSMYPLPSSRELISAMSCFLVFITCSFTLTCTLLLNAAVQDEIPEQRERETGYKKQKNWKHSLHLTYRNTLSHKALALISKNHPLSFGHRIHMITSAEQLAGWGCAADLPATAASESCSRFSHRRSSHCSTAEAPVEGNSENLVFVLQCT